MNLDVIILNCSSYDFLDPKTNKQVVGGKIGYLDNRIQHNDNYDGYSVNVINVKDLSVINSLTSCVPCRATLTCNFIPVGNAFKIDLLGVDLIESNLKLF